MLSFLADEHIDMPAVKMLKKIGISIVSVQEIGKRGLDDRELLNYARENKLSVVTRDPDFLQLHAKGISHSGIIFLTRSLGTGELIKEIQKASLAFENIDNAVMLKELANLSL